MNQSLVEAVYEQMLVLVLRDLAEDTLRRYTDNQSKICLICRSNCILKQALLTNIHGVAPLTDMYQQKWDASNLSAELVNCIYCHRMHSVVRMAPHLEKCMGMGGRLASRQAKRNLASTSNNPTPLTTAMIAVASMVTTGTATPLSVPPLIVQSNKKGQLVTTTTATLPSEEEDPDEGLFDFYASLDYSSDEDNPIDKSKSIVPFACIL